MQVILSMHVKKLKINKIKREYSFELRGKIEILSQEGCTREKIGKKIKNSKMKCNIHICWIERNRTNSTRKRCGWPKYTSNMEEKHFVITSKRNRRLPATLIEEKFNKSRQSPISVDTVKKRLCTVDLNGYK